jgi:hypothetical protein
MKKVIRNGKVAVLYSPDFGAGWYSWHHTLELVFHPRLIELVEQERNSEIDDELIAEILGIDEKDVPYISSGDVKIAWVNEGTVFRIDEYDGAESIVLQKDEDLLTA